MNREDVYELINTERDRQRAMWDRHHSWGFGDCSSVYVSEAIKLAVLTEETSESVLHIGKTGRADWEAQRAAARAHLIRIARRTKASDTALRDALQALDLEDTP